MWIVGEVVVYVLDVVVEFVYYLFVLVFDFVVVGVVE